jgi:hypothetical protein
MLEPKAQRGWLGRLGSHQPLRTTPAAAARCCRPLLIQGGEPTLHTQMMREAVDEAVYLSTTDTETQRASKTRIAFGPSAGESGVRGQHMVGVVMTLPDSHPELRFGC